jgi:23S rRNA (cytosine1962-C5)-methyltransferase
VTPATGYALLDAGGGRRLERFGDVITDRPAPGVDGPMVDRDAWGRAQARFDERWTLPATIPDPWLIDVDGITLELRATRTGQVGFFPEHAAHWAWLRDAAGDATTVLNLFAYTGPTTLALACAGASVVHVDASRPSVAWARRNAVLCDLADRPIRWLVDDATAFVARESRRGRRYDGFVVDPPSFGHSRGGRDWRIERDLDALLAGCAAIAGPRAFVLLTAHTPELAADELAVRLAAAFGATSSAVERGGMTLIAASGARLRLGSFARIMGR